VLVFSPAFPTYVPNIARRGARAWLSPLRPEHEFRPALADVRQFLEHDPAPRAIFLNSPHNPTGGVAAAEDLSGIAELVRGREVYVFSDEPYDRMVWREGHESILAQPGMLAQGLAAYTFSKSYSMSGWRLGFGVCAPDVAEMVGKLVNTSLSCVPPFVQLAGLAALERDAAERDRRMEHFRQRVARLVTGLEQVPGVRCRMPAGTFYAFPSVAEVCNRLGITSHGLAMYLLEGAHPERGLACLGGECFGEAGGGFLRLSCAEPPERLDQAVEFLAEAVSEQAAGQVARYLATRPEFRLGQPYSG
jgi:aspartate aminotransferase